MSPLLRTFVGSVWLRRSEPFGSWWLQSLETALKPGRVHGCLRQPRMLFCRGEPRPQVPRVEGPGKRVVVFNTFARCLDCNRQTGK
eukprot:3839552-Amphidinium_carterae.1